MRISITTKIIITLVVSITAVSIILGIFTYNAQTKSLMVDMNLRMNRVLDRLCRLLVYPLWNINFDEVKKSIVLEMEEKHIISIIVRDNHEKIIQGICRDEKWKVIDCESVKNLDNHEKSLRIKVIRKQIFKDSNFLGTVELHLTEHFINQKIFDEMLTIILRLLVLTMITVIVVFLTLRKTILSPLIKMHDLVIKLADHDLDAKVIIDSEDEIGEMARSLNIMSQTIQDYEYDLKSQKRRLIEMIKKIEEQNLVLQKLDKMKDDFLVNTSRELRKPLQDIIDLSESLSIICKQKLNNKNSHNLKMITSTGKRLALHVDDIMDMTNIKNHEIRLEYKPVDIKSLVDLIFELNMSLIQGKEIKLINKIRGKIPFAFADEHRVQQVLQNLLNLSLRCTSKGCVSISAMLCGDKIRIFVEDTGAGIEPDILLKIFSAWENVDANFYCTESRIGMGLPIAKKIVELHGGELSVESNPGIGTLINFTLPWCSEKTGVIPGINVKNNIQEEINIEEKYQLLDNRMTVLIVDDDPVILQVAGSYINHNDYNVLKAVDGIEAINLINQHEINIVLIDVVMPKTNGIQLCKEIRGLYDSAQLPVILMASKYYGEQLVEGLVSGANDYLTKPFSENELMTRIRTHLYLSETNKAYTRFVPREFLNVLGKDSIVDVRLGDHIRKKMTILFSDVRDFTSLSETLTPEENFNLINALLKRIGPIIRENGGFIDKYIGDSIMALFPDSPLDALNCSIAMKKELELYNVHRKKSGYKKIDIGIGIHTGFLMLGTIGESKRMEGTVISDAVNLSSRLEGLTKIYGASVILSQETLNEIKDVGEFQFRFLGMVNVKGKSRTVLVYELLDGENDDAYELKLKTLESFKKGINKFFLEEFSEAIECFKQIQLINPQDVIVSRYISRCEYYISNGVPDDWDSAEILEIK